MGYLNKPTPCPRPRRDFHSVPGRGESGYVEAEIVLAMSLSIVFDLWGPPSLVTTKFGSPSLVLCFIFTRVCVYIYPRG